MPRFAFSSIRQVPRLRRQGRDTERRGSMSCPLHGISIPLPKPQTSLPRCNLPHVVRRPPVLLVPWLGLEISFKFVMDSKLSQLSLYY